MNGISGGIAKGFGRFAINRCGGLLALTVCCALSFATSAWGYSQSVPIARKGGHSLFEKWPSRQGAEFIHDSPALPGCVSGACEEEHQLLSQAEWKKRRKKEGKRSIPPEKKARLKKKIQKWKSMSPKQREVLRKRMEKWKKRSPKERELYRKRHEQWRRLPPKERQKLKEKFKRWDQLPRKEQEEIRRKLRGR
jgi:hypothetical protein